MGRKQKQSKSTKIFWRIIISIVGIALVLIAVTNLLLFFFGDCSTAKISTRRFGGADDGRPVSQRYEWSVDYTFTDKAGKTHSGHTTRRGSDLGVNVENTVYYFSFAPFINSLANEAKPSIGQPLFIAVGIFLLSVMNKKKKKRGKSRSVTLRNTEPSVTELTDYDDSVEDVFHEIRKS